MKPHATARTRSQSRIPMGVLLVLMAGLFAAGAIRRWDVSASSNATAAPGQPQSRLEREAAARFARSVPQIRMPNGERRAPSNEAHALAIKVKLYKALLARDEESRDPTFRLKAEAELERRRPLHATLEWDDPAGAHQMTFVVEDSTGCALGTDDSLSLASDDLWRHPCLAPSSAPWEKGAVLAVALEAVGEDEPLRHELLRAVMSDMAAAAHLARTERP